MVSDMNYREKNNVIKDFIYDAERGFPVELICKAKDVRYYLMCLLSYTSYEISLLDYDTVDVDGIITDDDEIAFDIYDGKITLCPLILYSNEKGRTKLYSGEGSLKYVSSDCDEYFFNDEDCIGVFKFTIGG